tara:strand:+ start:651 stop:908 length:258 start_codon:yes stop_codon:yes gene_type:complete
MSRDLIIDMQISVNISRDYYRKITEMTNEELAEHICKSCFKNNSRFLMNYKIINGDQHRFKKVDMQEWFDELKEQENYYDNTTKN